MNRDRFQRFQPSRPFQGRAVQPRGADATDRDRSRRIEVDEKAEPVRLPGQVINELCAHALDARPEECCGLITGGDDNAFRDVHRCRNEMTARHGSDPETYPRDGREAYVMNELDYLKVIEFAESKGDRVTAVYHSHVGAGMYFSEMDQEYANAPFFPFPDAVQIVLAVCDGRVAGAGLFQRDAETRRFSGTAIELRAEDDVLPLEAQPQPEAAREPDAGPEAKPEPGDA